jgi:hypothetical protein
MLKSLNIAFNGRSIFSRSGAIFSPLMSSKIQRENYIILSDPSQKRIVDGGEWIEDETDDGWWRVDKGQ